MNCAVVEMKGGHATTPIIDCCFVLASTSTLVGKRYGIRRIANSASAVHNSVHAYGKVQVVCTLKNPLVSLVTTINFCSVMLKQPPCLCVLLSPDIWAFTFSIVPEYILYHILYYCVSIFKCTQTTGVDHCCICGRFVIRNR